MNLKNIIHELFQYLQLDLSVDDPTLQKINILGIAADSRRIEKDFAFIAVTGRDQDGHHYAESALLRGAVLLIGEKKFELENVHYEEIVQTPKVHLQKCIKPSRLSKGEFYILTLEDSKNILSYLAALWTSFASQDLWCVGVTGTNGKTSVTYLVEHLQNYFGKSTAVIGTVNHHLHDKIWPSEMTTPDAVYLHQRIQEMKNLGANSLAIEVSSHALDQKRAHHIDFSVAVFTNLTRDHLDYHGTMDLYFQAKAKLFFEVLRNSHSKNKFAIICTDDPWGYQLAKKVEKEMPHCGLLTYGENKEALLQFEILDMNFAELKLNVSAYGTQVAIKIPLIGTYNVQNVMAALLVTWVGSADISSLPEAWISFLKKSQLALKNFLGVPGRLQKIVFADAVNPEKIPYAFVDYAHTPDALENVLKTLVFVKEVQNKSSVGKPQKIYCIFGCGGDRDPGKRPMMAKVAQDWADFVVITSDNPRTENPEIILDQIEKGFSVDFKNYHRILDRAEAIAWTVDKAEEQDVILVAGKGHENYQIIGKDKKFFDDRLQLQQELVKKMLNNSN